MSHNYSAQDQLIARAEAHYTDDLEYHNWAHALDVMRNSDVLHERAIKFGAQVDRSLLLVAAAWHDADYHLPAGDDSRTKEQRSADLVCEKLIELSEAERAKVASAIIDTTVDKASKDSPMGVLLHFADIGYFAYPKHDDFLDRMNKWQRESGFADDEAAELTRKFGAHIILEAERYLPGVIGGDEADSWTDRVRRNIAQV